MYTYKLRILFLLVGTVCFILLFCTGCHSYNNIDNEKAQSQMENTVRDANISTQTVSVSEKILENELMSQFFKVLKPKLFEFTEIPKTTEVKLNIDFDNNDIIEIQSTSYVFNNSDDVFNKLKFLEMDISGAFDLYHYKLGDQTTEKATMKELKDSYSIELRQGEDSNYKSENKTQGKVVLVMNINRIID